MMMIILFATPSAGTPKHGAVVVEAGAADDVSSFVLHSNPHFPILAGPQLPNPCLSTPNASTAGFR